MCVNLQCNLIGCWSSVGVDISVCIHCVAIGGVAFFVLNKNYNGVFCFRSNFTSVVVKIP